MCIEAEALSGEAAAPDLADAIFGDDVAWHFHAQLHAIERWQVRQSHRCQRHARIYMACARGGRVAGIWLDLRKQRSESGVLMPRTGITISTPGSRSTHVPVPTKPICTTRQMSVVL
jgi:hypothetical protein